MGLQTGRVVEQGLAVLPGRKHVEAPLQGCVAHLDNHGAGAGGVTIVLDQEAISGARQAMELQSD